MRLPPTHDGLWLGGVLQSPIQQPPPLLASGIHCHTAQPLSSQHAFSQSAALCAELAGCRPPHCSEEAFWKECVPVQPIVGTGGGGGLTGPVAPRRNFQPKSKLSSVRGELAVLAKVVAVATRASMSLESPDANDDVGEADGRLACRGATTYS